MSGTPNTSKKILTSRQEIMDYAGLSKYLYLKFIRIGLPVFYAEGRCYAHTDNIDEFFKAITKNNTKNMSDEALIGDSEAVEGTPPKRPSNGGSEKSPRGQ